MRNQHITHLITRYIHGQLRPSQRARVVNHVRTCAACRAALAREEWIASDLRRELPGWARRRVRRSWPRSGRASGRKSAGRVRGPGSRRGCRVGRGVALVLMLAVDRCRCWLKADVRAEAAPQQPRPISTASPTPGMTETSEARAAGSSAVARLLPAATVAFVASVGATPAPVPQATVSPEARVGSRQ